MYSLKDLLESIPTNNCSDREEAKRDVSSGLSMNSAVVIENFMSCWVDMKPEEADTLSQQDAQYRDFLVTFSEKYHDHRQL